MYIVYAANANSYTSSVTKGAVMVVALSIATGILVYMQQVYKRFTFGFVVAGISLPIVALSGFHLETIHPLVMPYFLMQICISIVFVGLAAICIFPNLAGKKVDAISRDALKRLAEATTFVVHDVMNQSLSENEREENLHKFYTLFAIPTSTEIVEAKTLMKDSVVTEVNLYKRPHRFAAKEYGTLLSLLRHYLSILMTGLYFVKEGGQNMPDSYQSMLVDITASIRKCILNVKSVIELEVTYKDSLLELAELEMKVQAAIDLFKSMDEIESKDPFPYSILFIFLVLGIRSRRFFMALPPLLDAMGSQEQDVWGSCIDYFDGRQYNLHEVMASNSSYGTSMLRSTLSSLSSASLAIGENESPKTKLPERTELQFRHHTSNKVAACIRSVLHKLHLRISFLEVATQQAVALAVGTTIHVCNASYTALGGHSIWAVLTIVVLGAQGSIGGIIIRSRNRFIGTAGGGVLGLG